jgi:murein DD-endopeptidase MepM/ murein hydrolase activator NlpD
MKKDFLFSIILSFLLITVLDSLCQMHKPTIEIADVSKDHEDVVMEYGLPVDSFIVEENTILAGTSFSTLIDQLNIRPETTQTIIDKASQVFDLKKIKKGNIYKVFLSKDSLKTVDYLIYEQNATDYIFFNFKDTIHVEKRQKEIITETHTASGTIESSLWNAVVENGGDPMLAMKLSDVYAWSIDFFGLQKGDQFKVYYETQTVAGTIVEISKIHAAWFKHMGKEYYAIPFYQDSCINFYDEQGNNIKKAFLKAPLNFSRIASHFSNSRLHPILKIYRPHHGVDYSAAKGTPVQSIGDGVVLHASYSGGAGNYVKIRHNGTYTTGYMHLSGYGKGIRSGSRVRQGEIIGYVGSTGLSTGPHLDFRVWKNDQPIDPLKLESPPAKPVKTEDIEFFHKVRDVWKGELDNLIIPEKKDTNILAQNK